MRRMERLTSSQRRDRLIGAGVLASVLMATFLLDPIRPLSGRNLCGFSLLTGFPCPTCGMTRALCCISHGMVAQSLKFHVLGVVVYATLLVGLVKVVAELAAGRQFPWLANCRKRIWVSGVVVMALVPWAMRLREFTLEHPTAFHDSLLFKGLSAAGLI
jgi:hypothetical protein